MLESEIKKEKNGVGGTKSNYHLVTGGIENINPLKLLDYGDTPSKSKKMSDELVHRMGKGFTSKIDKDLASSGIKVKSRDKI
jgi:hypothetical protein